MMPTSVASADKQRTAIVLLNWNGWQDTILCLQSLLPLDWSTIRVYVVDNASRDDSLQQLNAWLDGTVSPFVPPGHAARSLVTEPAKRRLRFASDTAENWDRDAARQSQFDVVIMRSSVNRGFAGGNNIAVRYALKDPDIGYVWLLNNDTVVSDARAVDILRSAATSRKNLALVEPSIGYLSRPTELWFEGGEYLPFTAGGRHITRTQFERAKVPFLTGCAMFVPRLVMDRIGLLDEAFFVYAEDCDYSIRAVRDGIALVVDPTVSVLHAVSASAGGVSAWSYRHHIGGNMRLALRHFSLLYLPTILGFHLLKLVLLPVFKGRTLAQMRGYATGLAEGLARGFADRRARSA